MLCIGGQSVTQLRKRFRTGEYCQSLWHFNATGGTVALMIGTNDAVGKHPNRDRHTPDFFKRYLSCLLKDLEKRMVQRVILCTLPPIPKDAAANDLVVSYNQIIRELHMKMSHLTSLADVHSAFVSNAHRNIFEPDGLHPNYSGLRIINRLIIDACSRINY